MSRGKWSTNTPDTLQTICSDVFIKHVHLFLEEDRERLELRQSLSLQHPVGLCDRVFEHLYATHTINLGWLNIFHDLTRTRLSRVSLAHRPCNVKDLEFLAGHPVVDLDLSNCQFTEDFVSVINKLGQTLRSLKLECLDSVVDFCRNHMKCSTINDEAENGRLFGFDYIFDFPKLRHLCIRTTSFVDQRLGSSTLVHTEQDIQVLRTILCPLKSLSHLDLSMCIINVEQFECFDELQNLVWLSLNQVEISDLLKALRSICKAKKIRHLDLSGRVDLSTYDEGKSCLHYIITNLPCVTSLDISCTNLATPTPNRADTTDIKPGGNGDEISDSTKCSIAGLEGKQLEFLGLLDCFDDPCNWDSLPSNQVSGSGSEEQILLAARCYVDREYLLSSALTHLFLLFRYQTVKDECEALECILAGMEHNPLSKDVQISGSAALFYIVKGQNRCKLSQKQKRRLMLCLIAAMRRHTMDVRMVRNGCLTIYHMDIAGDVMFCFEELVKLLIYLLLRKDLEDLPQRICITLLNHFASIGKTTDKILFGDWGGIEAMLEIIRTKLEYGTCDEIMEVAWSALWNITDETPSNCEKFINGSGLELFRTCLTRFPEKSELWRNMMGLMGNIAEVRALRPQLMHPEFVPIFSDLLESEKDGIEVSYNAAGIFSHMTADGPESWTVVEPSREEIMERMIAAIERWPLDSKRNINYRSFCPILRLLTSYNAVAAQYWAVWALCNLTKILPDRYCEILKSEGGIEILQEVIAHPEPIQPIKDLAHMILDQMDKSLVQSENTNRSISDDVSDD